VYERCDVQPGAKIGRWTVIGKCEGSPPKWQCRCECGTVRDVLDRSLRFSGSTSCGCARREKALEKNAHQLAGQRFGKLYVVKKADEQEERRGCWWTCRCDCGKEVDVPGTLLYTGKKTSCGCATVKNYAYVDITGQRFHRLTALYMVEGRTSKGGMIWHCRCECGNELDVSYNNLVYSNMRSCGCQKREHDMQLNEMVEHVDGTSINHLRSRKTPSNNTTGVRGVYLIKGKYVAKIVFQKKQYLLGTYDRLADAAEARKAAEAEINGRVTSFYDCWKEIADADPEWAEQNPIRISVVKTNGELKVSLLPSLDAVMSENVERTDCSFEVFSA